MVRVRQISDDVPPTHKDFANRVATTTGTRGAIRSDQIRPQGILRYIRNTGRLSGPHLFSVDITILEPIRLEDNP